MHEDKYENSHLFLKNILDINNISNIRIIRSEENKEAISKQEKYVLETGKVNMK